MIYETVEDFPNPDDQEPLSTMTKNLKTVSWLVAAIVPLAVVATLAGIFSSGGPGSFQYESIRGEWIQIYGEGIYRHMSTLVAPQGIAQDVVTLLIALPVLLGSLYYARRGSQRARFVLAGVLGYLLVTYLIYLTMATYNELFLVYVALLCCCFFAFLWMVLDFSVESLPYRFGPETPVRFAGGFLMVNASLIGFLWLSVVLPPLLSGQIIPNEVEHYTTLIVQGLDLSLLLPAGFLSGLFLRRRQPAGYLFGPIYLLFLCFMMTALLAKIIAMGWLGQPIFPAVVVIPVLLLFSLACSWLVLKDFHP